jgi:hypothetical protein
MKLYPRNHKAKNEKSLRKTQKIPPKKWKILPYGRRTFS